jgi:hypothetical protein
VNTTISYWLQHLYSLEKCADQISVAAIVQMGDPRFTPGLSYDAGTSHTAGVSVSFTIRPNESLC